MKSDHPDNGPIDLTDQNADNDWVGAYGFGGHHGPGYAPRPGETRDAWDRAADTFLASVGDEDAARRLRKDYILAGKGHRHDRQQ